MKAPCSECGLPRAPQIMKRHLNSRPCRSQQIQNQLAERGLVPLSNLVWEKVLRWSGVSYARFPANAGDGYQKPWLWKRYEDTITILDYSGPLYEDLDDMLFVEEWVPPLLYGYASYNKKETLKPLVLRLEQINELGNEAKSAIVVAYALGGAPAVAKIIAEGLWKSER